jgi:hypothetical protein
VSKRNLRGKLAAAYKHGHGYDSPTYRSWKSMKNRCTRKADTQWQDYGGRGIKVCEKWLKFSGFLEDMGIRPEGKTLDRIDNEGNYEPSNCRWADIKQQRRNRRDNRIIEFNGQKMPLVSACEIAGLPYTTVITRLNKYGWSESKAFSQPIRPINRIGRQSLPAL